VIAGGKLGKGAVRSDQPQQMPVQPRRAAPGQARLAQGQANSQQAGGLADRVVVVLCCGIAGRRLDAPGMLEQQHPRPGRRRGVQQCQRQAEMQCPQRRFLPAGPIGAAEGRIMPRPFGQQRFGAGGMPACGLQSLGLGQ
jgi:hypothetical protein